MMKQVFRKRFNISIIFIKCDIHGQSGDLENEESSEWAKHRAKFRKISELDILRPVFSRIGLSVTLTTSGAVD